jgi:hypothetical protein
MVSNDQFKQFEDVRNEGLFNMFDPQARDLTDLTKDEWIEIMNNYDLLKKRYKATGKKEDV